MRNLLRLIAILLFIVPSAVFAASPGDLVKLADDGDPSTQYDTAVYYLGFDGARYAFPNAKTFFTWYADFASVKTVTPSELSSYRLAGNVTYRPGTRLVKVQSDPKVYAVEPGGVLRGIGNEAVADALYGTGWSSRVDDVSDAFFTNYVVGAPLTDATYPSGSVVRRISDNALFYVADGSKRRIATDAIRDSLRIREEYVLRASSLAAYPDGADVVSGETGIADTAGNGVDPSAPPAFTRIVPASDAVAVDSEASLLTLGYVAGKDSAITRLTVRLTSLTDKDTTDPDTDDGGFVYRSGPTANLTDLRFEDDVGNEIFGRKQLSTATSDDDVQTIVFTGRWEVPAGQRRTISLIAKFGDLVPVNEGYRATLLVSGTTVEVGGTAAAFTPTIDIAGTTRRTTADDFTVTLAAGGGGTYVRGTKDVDVNGFTFKATSTRPDIVRSLKVQGYVDEQEGVVGFLPGGDSDNGTLTRVSDILTNVRLYDGNGTLLSGPYEPDASGIIAFDGLDLAIPAGKTADVMVRADLKGTLLTETHPDKVAFDVADAITDIVVTDADGLPVRATGTLPNGGTTASRFVTVRENGTLSVTWQPTGGTALAGKEIQLGTLKFKGKYETFTVDSVAFVQPNGASASLGELRLVHGTTSVTASFTGNLAVFNDLGFALPKDDTEETYVLYGAVKPRAGGAVYGETITVAPSATGPFTVTSASDGTARDVTAFPSTGDLAYVRGGNSTSKVRFSLLTTSLVPGSVAGNSYRESEMPMFRFTFTANPAGPVRIGEFAFTLSPGDRGLAGADNDALERWANLNGDFADDDAVGSVRQVLSDGLGDPICEGANGHLRYHVFNGATEIASPSTHESSSGDYGVLSCDLPEGGELYVPAGAVLTFELQLDSSALAEGRDYSLGASLRTGSGNFAYTDIPSGAYTAITSAGGSVTGSTTVQK